MENQKLSQRFALDNSNSVFPSPFIPLFKLMENGNLYYETNGCLEMEKESIEKFITLNVNNEHYNFSNDQSSRFAMFYPRRFPRRRRRRRNTAKFLAESVEPINK